MSVLTAEQSKRKTKRSYSLSPESVAFLESVRKTREASSVSAVLEDILQMVTRGRNRALVDRAVADYYTSLSAQEVSEQAKWGELAVQELMSADHAG